MRKPWGFALLVVVALGAAFALGRWSGDGAPTKTHPPVRGHAEVAVDPSSVRLLDGATLRLDEGALRPPAVGSASAAPPTAPGSKP